MKRLFLLGRSPSNYSLILMWVAAILTVPTSAADSWADRIAPHPVLFAVANSEAGINFAKNSDTSTPFPAIFTTILLLLTVALLLSAGRRKSLLKELTFALERQKAEVARLRARFESLFNFVPIPLFILNEEGIICQSNARSCHDFGLNLQGKRLADLAGPEEAEKLEIALDCTLSGFDRVFKAVLKVIDRERYCRVMLLPFGGKEEPQVLCAIVDESERVHERTRILERIIDHIPIATVMIDGRGRVVIWNRASELITGIDRSEVTGKPLDLRPLFGGRELPIPALLLLDYTPEEISSKFRGRIRQHGQFPNAVETRGMIFSGREERYVHIVAARVQDDQGNLIGVVQCAKDITEELKLRENVFQIQKMEAIGRLVSGIAHDLNNILTVILGCCDLLAICLGDRESTERYIQEIRKASQRAGKLVERLLGYSKRQRFLPRKIDINESVRNAVNSIAEAFGEDVKLELNLASSPILCRVDPFHFEQSIVNLLVNAREAVSSGGKITVATDVERLDRILTIHHFSVPPGVYAKVSISDDGVGIERDVLKHIFEPYFTTKKGGSGLGLAMVYGFVNQNGGYITVDSVVGKGTTFTLYLPVITQEDEQGGEGFIKNILVVDDDSTVRELLVSTLSSAGYAVRSAGSYEEALEIFQENPEFFHLLLVDVVLPDRSGWDLAETLLKIKPDLKVLYMTDYNEKYLEKLGLDNGRLKQIIQKPFAMDELLRRIRGIHE